MRILGLKGLKTTITKKLPLRAGVRGPGSGVRGSGFGVRGPGFPPAIREFK